MGQSEDWGVSRYPGILSKEIRIHWIKADEVLVPSSALKALLL